MKKIIWILGVFWLMSHSAFTQVAVNTTGAAADSSAILDVQSTTQGVLIPRMTQAQRDAISNPVDGLVIYQTDNATGYYLYSTKAGVTAWRRMADAEDMQSSTLTKPIVTTSGNYTISPSDYTIIVNGNHTVTLPLANASNVGREYVIRAVAGTVVLNGGGSNILMHSQYLPSISLNNYVLHVGHGHNGQNIYIKIYSVTVQSDGTHWIVTGDHTYTHQ